MFIMQNIQPRVGNNACEVSYFGITHQMSDDEAGIK